MKNKENKFFKEDSKKYTDGILIEMLLGVLMALPIIDIILCILAVIRVSDFEQAYTILNILFSVTTVTIWLLLLVFTNKNSSKSLRLIVSIFGFLMLGIVYLVYSTYLIQNDLLYIGVTIFQLIICLTVIFMFVEYFEVKIIFMYFGIYRFYNRYTLYNDDFNQYINDYGFNKTIKLFKKNKEFMSLVNFYKTNIKGHKELYKLEAYNEVLRKVDNIIKNLDFETSKKNKHKFTKDIDSKLLDEISKL